MSEETPFEYVKKMTTTIGDMVNEEKTWLEIFGMVNTAPGSWKVITETESVKPPFYVIDLDCPDWFISISETEDERYFIRMVETPEDFLSQIEPEE